MALRSGGTHAGLAEIRDSLLEIELPDAREMRRLEVERIVVNFPDIRGRQQIS